METQKFQITPLGCSFLMLLGLLFFGILFPALLQERDSARRSLCADRMRNLVQALAEYRQFYGSYPLFVSPGQVPFPRYSWRVLILPFLGEMELCSAIHLDEPWDSPHNTLFHDPEPAVFRCPNSPGVRYALIPRNSADDDFAQFGERFLLIEQPESTVWMKPEKYPLPLLPPKNNPPPHSGGEISPKKTEKSGSVRIKLIRRFKKICGYKIPMPHLVRSKNSGYKE